ncbi:MAG: hypothetical protein QOF10_1511 [Kribbellaceae bacterium]|jgi:aminoglycoside 6'-N-acetyltransferase|nr:hypothetical protein [Kribbellaceae bacterium]
MVIPTERLVLRRFRAEDAASFAAYQGNGYATEAVRGLLDHLFVERNLHRVAAECDARNASSARLLERVGFRQEGLRRAATWFKGEWTDDLVFGLLRSDWH